jgi:hypothetical protein
MSLTTGEMSAADLAAVVGNSNNGDGFGGTGNGWWIILLFLCLFGNGGWGNNGGSSGNGGFYPYYLANNTDNGVQEGFYNAAITGQLNGIQSGLQNIATEICNNTAGIQQTINAGFATAEVADNARATANMQQLFGLSQQFANCCCENRLGLANLGADIAREACADRAAVIDGVRDIIANQTAGIQTILTQMCNDKIDAKNDTINQLRQELLYARGQASQDVQTARILAGQTAEVDALYNRLNACPVGTVPVYGQQPIFTCPQTAGCGCGV